MDSGQGSLKVEFLDYHGDLVIFDTELGDVSDRYVGIEMKSRNDNYVYLNNEQIQMLIRTLQDWSNV